MVVRLFFCAARRLLRVAAVTRSDGHARGTKAFQGLFTATFIALLMSQPVYGALVAELPRRLFVPIVYHFFVANLALFWVLLTLGIAPVIVALVFFVWVSVFSLFAVAVFWSFMADLLTAEATPQRGQKKKKKKKNPASAIVLDHDTEPVSLVSAEGQDRATLEELAGIPSPSGRPARPQDPGGGRTALRGHAYLALGHSRSGEVPGLPGAPRRRSGWRRPAGSCPVRAPPRPAGRRPGLG